MNAGPKIWSGRIPGLSLPVFLFAFASALVPPVYG